MASNYRTVSYTTNAGTIGRIRMSLENSALAIQGGIAAVPTDPNLFAFSSNPGSKRKKKLNARGVVLGREVGVAPNTFIRRTFVPITTQAALSTIAINTPVVLVSGNYNVLSKIEEA